MPLIDAYRRDTGEKVRIPAHWLDHPTIGAQFRLPPSAAKAEPAKKSAPAKKADADD